MRKTALAAVVTLVSWAATATAGTPSVALLEIDDNRLTPIAATFPPMSEAAIGQRCQGFFRAMQVRRQLAQAMGLRNLDLFAFLTDLPLARLTGTEATGRDFVTSYMVAFGPLNPPRTARSGLFNADRKTCTEFLDALG
ncbi:hypothetical protein [Aestuariivita sp.]|jgi:hypothetical protein|uniref:hypothetical protein n=1 Tax=Aestuariivita sp. TaxID=1872407 RepID=UPI0021745047|nr:hypothetical protein [Aestuariivita sp.]MCE8008900.1 hypothetical protein [Aestuariivita sp.]